MPRLDAPAVAPTSIIQMITSYRLAVHVSWKMRSIVNMSQRGLCERTGMRPSHLSHYLNDAEVNERGIPYRNMPAQNIPEFEKAVGNTFITQWLCAQSMLTVLEAQIADQGLRGNPNCRQREIDITPYGLLK